MFSCWVRGQGAVLWGLRTWMSKFAPASISIWTIASSPAAQAYISGVIPCMDQRQMLNTPETEHDGPYYTGLGLMKHRSWRPACPTAQLEQSCASPRPAGHVTPAGWAGDISMSTEGHHTGEEHKPCGQTQVAGHLCHGEL